MRPVLVGIDPGSNRGGPLSPNFPCGARLARYANLDYEDFLLKFDRINLHSASHVMKDWDQNAAGNLYPILRGRRVIALGRRVATALWMNDVKDFQWSLRGDFVGAVFPHPSGRNHKFNDAKTVGKASRFLSKSIFPCIHVEGPDGSGKSTLAKDLSKILRRKLIPTQGPPGSWDECLKRVDKRISPGIVCDRSSGLISELVYGPVIRGKTIVNEEFIWESVVFSLIYSVTFVYCKPPRSLLNPLVRKGEDPEHIRKVNERLHPLADRYDHVMNRLSLEGARVITYDRTRQTPEDIAECVG